MLLDIGRVLSLLLSILSLEALLASAFFVPSSHWEERLLNSIARIILAGCICFASGMLFSYPARRDSSRDGDLLHTLPVRLFFFALLGMALMFTASWYLETYYVPMLWQNQPH